MTDFPKTLEQMREEERRHKTRYTPSFATLPEDYARNLEKDNDLAAIIRRADRLTRRPQKATPQVMNYDDARTIAWRIMKNIASARSRKMQVDDCNRNIITELIKYTIADPSCSWNLQKGIFLFGPVGTGKTFLMQAMSAMIEVMSISSLQFRITSTIEMAEKVRNINTNPDKNTEPLSRYYAGNWCFDDIGQEPFSILVYGDTRPILEPVITRRYTNSTIGHCITHATSNLSPDDLESHYGTRLADRFKEMFNFVFLDGETRRG